jgi:hypothetical protein
MTSTKRRKCIKREPMEGHARLLLSEYRRTAMIK